MCNSNVPTTHTEPIVHEPIVHTNTYAHCHCTNIYCTSKELKTAVETIITGNKNSVAAVYLYSAVGAAEPLRHMPLL